MYKNLPQYKNIYPRYENREIERFRKKQDLRFLRQVGDFDVYVATNLTHIYGVYGEDEDQYIPVFLGFAMDSKEQWQWVQESIKTLRNWGYLK